MKSCQMGFAGMTHLGINSAVAVAEKGFKVICYDGNEKLISDLSNNILSISEPNLAELLIKNQQENRLQFFSSPTFLYSCDIVYISTDVPTNDEAVSDLPTIYSLIEKVVQHLNSHAILVILCQVPPGFTRSIQKYLPLSRVYYQVETLIFGKAIDRALFPERFIIGCEKSKQQIDSRFHNLLSIFGCPILLMRYESAELAKISINCCLVAHITVANLLSEICENIDADWSEIYPALKLDKRIGQHAYLNPGLGIAGGNLERDLKTVINLGYLHGTETNVVQSWINHSNYKKNWVLKILHQKVFSIKPKPALSVLGLAYKENTHSIQNSPSIYLLNYLKPYFIRVYDPVVDSSIVLWVQGKSSLKEAIADTEVLIIMTPWLEFKKITPDFLKKIMQGNIIIDPYQVLNGADFKNENFDYFTMGVNTTC